MDGTAGAMASQRRHAFLAFPTTLCCIAAMVTSISNNLGDACPAPDAEMPARSPAQVYPVKEAPGQWIVAPPEDAAAADRRVFTGPDAQHDALVYALKRFGGSRFFPY